MTRSLMGMDQHMKASARVIMRGAEEELARLAGVRSDMAHVGWVRETVFARLVGSYETILKLPDRAKHRGIKSIWPDDIFAKAQDKLEWERFQAEVAAIELGEEETRKRASEKNRVVIPPSAADISNMERVLPWPAVYIPDQFLRVVVLNCALTVARNKSLREMCRQRGWPYSTTQARCGRACDAIANGLAADGVAVW